MYGYETTLCEREVRSIISVFTCLSDSIICIIFLYMMHGALILHSALLMICTSFLLHLAIRREQWERRRKSYYFNNDNVTPWWSLLGSSLFCSCLKVTTQDIPQYKSCRDAACGTLLNIHVFILLWEPLGSIKKCGVNHSGFGSWDRSRHECIFFYTTRTMWIESLGVCG